MLNDIFYQRLQDLQDNIAKDQALLKEFEEALSYEDEPRRLRKYKRDIQRQKESIDNYTNEYQELEQKLAGTSEPQMQVVKNQLQLIGSQVNQIDAKLNIVLDSQVVIHQDIHEMRQTLLNRYSVTEQSILKAITEQLNQHQLAITQKMLDAIEANQISESEMLQMLAVLEERIPSLPPSSQTEVAEIIKSPQLDAKHKITVTFPIVPLLVNYEGELELGTGFNIQSAWDELMNKLRRK